MGTHRFRIKADVEQAELREVIEAPLTVDQSVARLETDVTLVDDSLLEDLKIVMAQQGYEFVATSPTIPLADRFPDSGGTNLWGLRIIEDQGFFGKVTPAGVASLLAAEPGLFNGGIIETIDMTVTEAAGVVSLNLQKAGGGNLTVQLSENLLTYTAGSVTLTTGTDTSPTVNYVWIEDVASVATLMAATTGWPATEHCPVATVIVQSAAGVSADGAYKVHAWTDHVKGTNDQGHLSHLNFWIRQQNATWQSGVVPNVTITPQGGSPDNVEFDNSAGVVLQLHDHAFPLRDQSAGDPIYVINDSVTPYRQTTDLNSELTDSAGVSMSGRDFALVIWGVVSEKAADCKLMCNLPSGSYSNATDLQNDPNGYADYSIPADYTGTGFLIAELLLEHSPASGGTWTLVALNDLRGLIPNTTAGAGGAAAGGAEFSDALFRVFDNGDSTKKIALEASAITTSTTRTAKMPDRDLSLLPEYDATVDAAGGGDYLLPSAAFTAGATSVYVKRGTYNETVDVTLPDGGRLVGEGEVVINFTGAFGVRNIVPGGSWTAGTITVTSGSAIVTGSLTNWLGSPILPGWYMLIGNVYYEIASVDNATQITLTRAYEGNTISTGISYLSVPLAERLSLENVRVTGSSTCRRTTAATTAATSTTAPKSFSTLAWPRTTQGSTAFSWRTVPSLPYRTAKPRTTYKAA
jgi:hypothetical protein